MTKPERDTPLRNLKLTPEMLASVEGLSSAKAAAKLGVGKTTVTDARAKLNIKREVPRKTAKSAKIEQKGTSIIVEVTDTVAQTKDHIEERMRSRGFDPEQYTFTYGFSEWEAQTPRGVETLYSARASATEKRPTGKPTVAYDDIVSVIEGHVATPVSERPEFAPNTFVFNFADPQIGKVDINGGTQATIERFMNSLDHARSLLDAEPATEIVWADLGDGIENFCNTSSQRQTNDLNLVEQVRILRRLQVTGLMALSDYAPVTHVSVPSNHSQNRVGFQAPASTAHDDWGLEVQVQLEEAFAMAGAGHTRNPITFRSPDAHLESLSHTTVDGTRLGFVHGHRSNSQNNLETWWAGQSLGRQPTWDADILLVGHFHNYGVRSVGDNRYIVTTPSLDGGSSWFTVSRGNMATAGVLAMRVANKRITYSQII
jgi:predicted phosphodiesterase